MMCISSNGLFPLHEQWLAASSGGADPSDLLNLLSSMRHVGLAAAFPCDTGRVRIHIDLMPALTAHAN